MIEIDDRITPEQTFEQNVARLVALCEGLEGGTVHCGCGRYHALQLANDLRDVLVKLRVQLLDRGEKVKLPENDRFAFLEIE